MSILAPLDITRESCISAAGDAYRLYHHPVKGKTSRAIRRFLGQFAQPSLVTPQCYEFFVTYANDDGYSPEQLKALERFALQVEAEFLEYAKATQATAVPLSLVVNPEYGVVAQTYLIHDLRTASLSELRSALEAFLMLADLVTPLASKANTSVFFDCPVYTYRNKPCNIQPDELLWEVSGQDKLTGLAGVLEWCYSEDDAREIAAEMLKFPLRFENISAKAFLSALPLVQ